MVARIFFPLLLPLACWLLTGCGGEPKKNEEKPQITKSNRPALDTAVSNTPERMNRELTTETKAKIEKQANAPIPVPPKVKPLGPPGYITRANVELVQEPKKNAAVISVFKIYENVVILETKMTDENGQVKEFPT